MIWGVGAGRKLLKSGGNCCESVRDAGLLFERDVVGMLRIDNEPPADFWSVVYSRLICFPSVLVSAESNPVVGVVNLDEFDGSLSVYCVKEVSCIRVSWSLIFEVYVLCDVCWEIILLSPEDLCEVSTEGFVCSGRHGGNSSVFQELVGKPNLC